MSKRLGEIIGCKDKTPSWHLFGFPNVMVVTSGQKYHVGEKLTVILYAYNKRHAGGGGFMSARVYRSLLFGLRSCCS